jgi:hypothetical protein
MQSALLQVKVVRKQQRQQQKQAQPPVQQQQQQAQQVQDEQQQVQQYWQQQQQVQQQQQQRRVPAAVQQQTLNPQEINYLGIPDNMLTGVAVVLLCKSSSCRSLSCWSVCKHASSVAANRGEYAWWCGHGAPVLQYQLAFVTSQCPVEVVSVQCTLLLNG